VEITLRTVFYGSLRNARALKRQAHSLGESTLHHDFIDNNNNVTDGTKGRLTFDIIADIPLTPEQILLELLLGKLKNNTITFEQLKTLIRLEHRFELTQTTRDKILIAVQGIIGTLRDRLKSAFNL